MVRHIKLMADYQCWPLWHGPGSDTIGNIDPATLPISEALQAALVRWSEKLDGALNWDDPAGTVWPEGFWAEFDAENKVLAARLREELGAGFVIHEHSWGADQRC